MDLPRNSNSQQAITVISLGEVREQVAQKLGFALERRKEFKRLAGSVVRQLLRSQGKTHLVWDARRAMWDSCGRPSPHAPRGPWGVGG